jgi:hypothetical protein
LLGSHRLADSPQSTDELVISTTNTIVDNLKETIRRREEEEQLKK